MTPEAFDLAGQVFDHLIIDVNEYPCGKVDDIEIEGEIGKPLRVKAILVGPGAWMARLPGPIRRITEKFLPPRITRVPWEYIEEITPRVKLRLPAEALDLALPEAKAARFIPRWIRQ